MPPDDELPQDRLDALKALLIPSFDDDLDYTSPLLDVFGLGYGFGLYTILVGKVFKLYDIDSQHVISEISQRLRAKVPGSTQWSLFMLAELHKGGIPPIANEHELIAACLDGPEFVRVQAAHCLGNICDERANAMLQTLLNDHSAEVREEALLWLEESRQL